MANNYMQFSENIKSITENERKWLSSVLGCIGSEEQIAWIEGELGIGVGIDEEEDWPRFEWELQESELWIYATEDCDLGILADIISAFLRKFRPKEVFTLTWAEVCSKPRLGEFGGGWMYVTANKTIFGDTWSEVDKIRKVDE